MERRLTRIGDFRIHSVHAGSGDPVVLLHGLSGSHRWWRFTLPTLAREYRVHIPELIGFGSSRTAARHPLLTETAELLVGWLDRLGIARPHLVGHSMGGQISLHLAADHPERVDRLALVDAAGIPRALSATELARLVAEVAPPSAWGAPGFLPTIAVDALRAGPRALWRGLQAISGDDVRPLLSEIGAETLVIWGALDPLLPLAHGRQLAEGIPDARLVVIDGAAHNPMADRPIEFNRVLLDFLAKT